MPNRCPTLKSWQNESLGGLRRVRMYRADQDPKEILPEAVLCLLGEEIEVVKVKRNHYSYLLHKAQQRLFTLNRQASQVRPPYLSIRQFC